MHPYPHLYTAAATGSADGSVVISSPGLPEVHTAPPPEFDGPGGVWSPETLLCASLADCFVLSFRAVARASRLGWTELTCRVEGVLDRVDGIGRFSRYTTFATLTVPANVDVDKARKLLERADHICLISNSLRADGQLVAEVLTVDCDEKTAIDA